MDIKEIAEITDNVDGWLTIKEGELLYNLAKRCNGDGVIVEIGSWKGGSTIWLGSGSRSNSGIKVYAIDPHTGSYEHQKPDKVINTFVTFLTNISVAKLDDLIEPIVKTSEDAARDFELPIELIFIDGAHEYEMVKLDFDLWFPKVIDGGIMAFHDTIGWWGPREIVRNRIFRSKYFRNVGFVNSITFAEKVKENTLHDRIRNRYILSVKNLYEFGGKLKWPKPLKAIGKVIVELLH